MDWTEYTHPGLRVDPSDARELARILERDGVRGAWDSAVHMLRFPAMERTLLSVEARAFLASVAAR